MGLSLSRSAILLATIGAGALVLVFLNRETGSTCVDGGGMRLRVGQVVYDVPASADASPYAGPRTPGVRYNFGSAGRGQFCQESAVSVIDTRNFSFRLSDDENVRGQTAPSIGRTNDLARHFQPDFPAFRRSEVVRITPSALNVDQQDRSARLTLEVALSGGTIRRIPADCQWAPGVGTNGEGLVGTCWMAVPLAGGNTLTVVVTPPENDLDNLGTGVLRALGTAEDFARGGRTS